jgi:thioredoxin 1
MTNVITLNEANFDEQVLASEVPVIVDYWASWCGPCRLLGPVIEQIADERSATIKVGKVNVDEQPGLAERAGVHGIPFVVLYRDGQPLAEAIGAQPKHALEQSLGLEPRVLPTAAGASRP